MKAKSLWNTLKSFVTKFRSSSLRMEHILGVVSLNRFKNCHSCLRAYAQNV